MQNRLHLILIILLIAISTSTTWLIITSGQVTLPQNKPQNPDSFITDVNAIQFDKLGKPGHIFKSPLLINYLQDNTTKITNPFYIFQNNNEPPWHVQSDQGKAIHGAKTIVLTGHVKIRQLPGINSRNLTLFTDKIIFYPKRSFAETDRPVTIKQPGIIIQGIGLEANLKTGEIKLLSKMRGEYKKI